MLSKMLFTPILINENREFPRYGIMDTRKKYRSDRFWKGGESKVWTHDRKKAMTWVDYQEVIKTIRDITRQEFKDLPSLNFTYEISIEVLAATGVTPEDIINWIRHSAKIQIDYFSNGMGPNGSQIFLKPNTNQMKEVKKPKS